MELNKEEKRAILEMIRSEGWRISKGYLKEYADIVEGELVSAQDKDIILASAYKLKFGTWSIRSFFLEMERIAKELDNSKDL